MTELEIVAMAAVRECERAGGDEPALVRLLDAHAYAVRRSFEAVRPNVADFLRVGQRVENVKASKLRVIPAKFSSGQPAPPAPGLRPLVNDLFAQLGESTDPQGFARDLLALYPFRDGNVRTAWLIMNWIGGTLLNPVPVELI